MLLSPPLPRWARAGLAALVLAAPDSARADVVAPPPMFCPPGTQAETSHRGPECVKVAPKNCPRGWHGEVGGTCSLRPCSNDDGCQPGEACVEHLACLESFVDDLYDYSDDPSEGRAEQMPPPDLIAAPPPARRRRPSPVTRFNAVNLCSAEVRCDAPRQCLPEKICVPKGTRALAYQGTNITAARVARKIKMPAASASPSSAPDASAPDASAAPLQASATASAPTLAAPPSSDARPLEGTAPVRGGCAGCATTEPSVPLSGLGLLGLAVLLAARRRR